MSTSKFLNHNGNYIHVEENIFAAQNRSFRFGDGLFETMFASGMRIPLFKDHFHRLAKGMQYLQFEIPDYFTFSFVEENILRLLNRNKHYLGAKVRLSVYRNDGGAYTPENNTFSFLIETSVLEKQRFILNREKIVIDICDEVFKPVNSFSKYKTANALLFVKAGLWTKKNNLDDCIILNTSKNICEALYSNIFVLAEKYLATPLVKGGCVNGIMRNHVIKVAQKSGFDVDEVMVLEEDLLLRADEIWLTNAVSGICWVMGFRDRRYFFSQAEKMTEALNKSLAL